VKPKISYIEHCEKLHLWIFTTNLDESVALW